jgi:hypothetical protein
MQSINLKNSINPTNDNRANFAIVDPQSAQLDAPHVENTGTCQSGGITPLYKKTTSSSETIKTIDDIGNIIEVKTVNKPTFDFTVTSLRWRSVAYGAGVFVAIASGTDTYKYSTDGITWTNGTLPGSSETWIAITFGGTKFVAIVGNSNKTAYSTDGINWTAGTLTQSRDWLGISYVNGKYIVVGSVSEIQHGTDGINWAEVDTGAFHDKKKDVAYGAGRYIFQSEGTGQCFSSTDLAAFATIDDVLTLVIGRSVVYAVSKFVMMSSTDHCYTSTDGITWTERTLPQTAEYPSVCHDGTYYIACAVNNQFIYSTDAITWYGVGIPNSYDWWKLATNGSGLSVCAPQENALTSLVRITQTSVNNVYSNSELISGDICKYGLYSQATNNAYEDIKYGATKVYGIKTNGKNIFIDEISATTFLKTSNVKTIGAVKGVYSVRFMRHATPTDDLYFFQYAVGYIYCNINSDIVTNSIGLYCDNIYYLSNTDGTDYILLVNERISNSDGNTISWAKTYTITLGSPSAQNSKDGWFYSYVDGTTIGVVGVEYVNPNYKFEHYTVDATGAFTEITTAGSSATMKYGLFGMVAEYEEYQIYSALSFPYKSLTTKNGTGADGRDFLGYYSVINRLDYSENNYFYLRAVYNRALKSADTLSITENTQFVGRVIDFSNVDFTYRPQILTYDSKCHIVYKDLSGSIQHAVLLATSSCTTQLTKIEKNRYLLNTIDVANVIDTTEKRIISTGMDYNGAVWYDAASKYTFKICNDLFQTSYNTETGVTIAASDLMSSYRDQSLIFNTLLYNYFVLNGALVPSNKFNSETYINDNTFVPIPIYATIQNNFVFWDGEIYPQVSYSKLNIDLAEQISNALYPDADFFYLFGNSYFHDGQAIYLINISDNTAEEVCRAIGLNFVAFSQSVAYFYSYSDNSLWVFDGGRALKKIVQLNGIFDFTAANLVSGDYSTRENCLFLAKGTKLMLMYDERISSYERTTGTAIVRDSGIYYSTTTGIDSLTPFAITGYTALTLKWQSAYFKNPATIQNIEEIIFYLKSASSAAGTFTVAYYAFDATQTFSAHSQNFSITAAMYDSAGYVSVRYRPNVEQVYGWSIRIETTMDLLLVDCSVATGTMSVITVPANQSI